MQFPVAGPVAFLFGVAFPIFVVLVIVRQALFKDSRAENGGVIRGLWVRCPGLPVFRHLVRVLGGPGPVPVPVRITIMPLND